MDSTCWKVIGIAGIIVAALVTTIKILWGKIAEERREAEQAKAEIIALHKQRIVELEGFKRMIETKGNGP